MRKSESVLFDFIGTAYIMYTIMFMFIRQSRQHYMPDIQSQTETDSETDKQTDREYRQYDKLNKKRREK